VEGAKCVFMQINTDDYVSEFKAKWDDINGITGLSFVTSKGTFLQIGTGQPNHYEHSFKFDQQTQLVGLHGISIKNKNGFEIEKLGVISMNVECQSGVVLVPYVKGSSAEATGVLVGALLVVVGLVTCILCSYCCYKKQLVKTVPA